MPRKTNEMSAQERIKWVLRNAQGFNDERYTSTSYTFASEYYQVVYPGEFKEVSFGLEAEGQAHSMLLKISLWIQTMQAWFVFAQDGNLNNKIIPAIFTASEKEQ